jgi:hypothetical protein
MRLQAMDNRWSTRSLSWIGIRFGQIRRIVNHACRQISGAIRGNRSRRATHIVVSCLSLTLLAAKLPQQGGGGYVVFLPVIPFERTIFYVSPDGDDNNPGTRARPWRSVSKAVEEAEAGDTVIFQDGTYECRGQDGWNDGKPGRPITFKAENSLAAIWHLSEPGWLIELNDDRYINFEGLVLRGNQSFDLSRHVTLGTCDHISFEDCLIYDTTGNGVQMEDSSDSSFRNCEFRNENATSHKDGILIYNGHNILIDGCELSHCAHTGIGIKTGSNITISNSDIHHTGGHCISVGSHTVWDGPDRVTIHRNRIHEAEQWGTSSGPHVGVRIHLNASNVKIHHNDICGNDTAGLRVRSSALGPIEIYNNTFYDNNVSADPTTASIHFYHKRDEPGTPIIRVKNNIIYHTASEALYAVYVSSDLEKNVDMDYNLFYSSTGIGAIRRNGTTYSFEAYVADYEPHSLPASDPLFREMSSYNFNLQANSPAIDEGAYIGFPHRGNAPDIGAHECKNPEARS